ncbi:MAG: NAD-dependent epimerase/dehydratase family protein, partial [Pseudomonadota bacterium]
VDGADGLIHAAGLTLARADDDYQRVNVAGAAAAAKTAADAKARFVHLSSMSAREPHLSPYAASKRASEAEVLEVAPGAAILRLPAIYGPRDLVTLPFFKLVKTGWAPRPATAEPGRFSLLYVDDAAGAVLAALRAPALCGVFEVGDSEEDGVSWGELGETLGAAFGRAPRSVAAPRWILSLYNRAALGYARAFNAAPTARSGQVNEFFHPDWVARNNLLSDSADWTPAVRLEEGFAKTVRWYQDNGYL